MRASASVELPRTDMHRGRVGRSSTRVSFVLSSAVLAKAQPSTRTESPPCSAPATERVLKPLRAEAAWATCAGCMRRARMRAANFGWSAVGVKRPECTAMHTASLESAYVSTPQHCRCFTASLSVVRYLASISTRTSIPSFSPPSIDSLSTAPGAYSNTSTPSPDRSSRGASGPPTTIWVLASDTPASAGTPCPSAAWSLASSSSLSFSSTLTFFFGGIPPSPILSSLRRNALACKRCTHTRNRAPFSSPRADG
mmetsp:Transcript_29020/g.56751  ORF Transcript_29020/g.56751 Transcript_29020/m.56751 type:complete len:254 (-) Transcript_29020:41-802(-)